MPRGIPKSGKRNRITRVYRYLNRYRKIILLLLEHSQVRCFFCGKLFTAEDFPKRKLDRITIHHINGNHEDNRPENLAFAHRTCHKRHHMKERKKNEKNSEKRIL